MMNYIKRLEHELQEAQLDKQKADEIVNELFQYLNSSKFQCGDELKYIAMSREANEAKVAL